MRTETWGLPAGPREVWCPPPVRPTRPPRAADIILCLSFLSRLSRYQRHATVARGGHHIYKAGNARRDSGADGGYLYRRGMDATRSRHDIAATLLDATPEASRRHGRGRDSPVTPSHAVTLLPRAPRADAKAHRRPAQAADVAKRRRAAVGAGLSPLIDVIAPLTRDRSVRAGATAWT